MAHDFDVIRRCDGLVRPRRRHRLAWELGLATFVVSDHRSAVHGRGRWSRRWRCRPRPEGITSELRHSSPM